MRHAVPGALADRGTSHSPSLLACFARLGRLQPIAAERGLIVAESPEPFKLLA
jgi:hypothetical protein